MNLLISKIYRNKCLQLGSKILETMMCAGKTRKDSCQGDSEGDQLISLTQLTQVYFHAFVFVSWCVARLILKLHIWKTRNDSCQEDKPLNFSSSNPCHAAYHNDLCIVWVHCQSCLKERSTELCWATFLKLWKCNSLTANDWRNSVQLCPGGCDGQSQICSAKVQMWPMWWKI